MKIDSVTISNDLTQLNVTISDAADLISLRFWNNDTYKDFSQAIDLSAKLTGATTENLTVTLSDINEDYFDGIYFIEAEDDDETSINFAVYLNKYKECVIDTIKASTICDSCLKTVDDISLNVHMLLRALELSIETRVIDEMLTNIRALDKFCTGDCRSCGQYGNEAQIDNVNVNFNAVTIKFDGGSLD